jgi:hypothetical protein
VRVYVYMCESCSRVLWRLHSLWLCRILWNGYIMNIGGRPLLRRTQGWPFPVAQAILVPGSELWAQSEISCKGAWQSMGYFYVVKTTNACTELYHSFIQYTGSYMFRQWSAVIRELLRFVWDTWNAGRMGGISYNVWLRDLCAGVLWFRFLCFPAECYMHNTPAHRPYKHTLYDIPLIRSVCQVTETNPRSSLMMADHCRNM